ncbi:hypothetical protein LSH36_339g00038 [Paralvinella palmiformis]|uniref:Uncharacterized protein n=1 Tax=Paralvinella palmiformis TaxID=53620 RepID=A0AAD9JF96_9ANNE|nr:hypothetical protein LSH36_339g00038 [Paralvinella palmiformis]
MAKTIVTSCQEQLSSNELPVLDVYFSSHVIYQRCKHSHHESKYIQERLFYFLQTCTYFRAISQKIHYVLLKNYREQLPTVR